MPTRKVLCTRTTAAVGALALSIALAAVTGPVPRRTTLGRLTGRVNLKWPQDDGDEITTRLPNRLRPAAERESASRRSSVMKREDSRELPTRSTSPG